LVVAFLLPWAGIGQISNYQKCINLCKADSVLSDTACKIGCQILFENRYTSDGAVLRLGKYNPASLSMQRWTLNADILIPIFSTSQAAGESNWKVSMFNRIGTGLSISCEQTRIKQRDGLFVAENRKLVSFEVPSLYLSGQDDRIGLMVGGGVTVLGKFLVGYGYNLSDNTGFAGRNYFLFGTAVAFTDFLANKKQPVSAESQEKLQKLQPFTQF
jgi:hypothetical protein